MQSSFLELFGPENVAKARRASRVIEAIIFGLVLYACGGMTGYWIRSNEAMVNRNALVQEHQRERQLLIDNYTGMLNYLTGKVEQNAASIGAVISNSEEAANIAQKAANKADVAADKAVTAAKQSAAAVGRAERVPEPTRDQINRAVDRANRSVGK